MNAIKQSLNWNSNRASLSKAELSLIHCLTVYWSYFLKVKKKCKSKCGGQDGFVVTIFNLYTFTNNKLLIK